jgi:N,N'-diacetyllegionaminate synthase
MTPWNDAVFIIAEAGINHNGDIASAMKLIDAAADAGCDAVKFQTFFADQLAAKHAPMAEYQKTNTGVDESQFDMLKRLELSEKDHLLLIKKAKEREIVFLSSAFDLNAIDLLVKLNLPFWKIPSGEITNYPYLSAIAKTGKPVILSTGMATLSEIEGAITVLINHGLKRANLCLLHCNTEYPTELQDVNLKAMNTIGRAFDTAFGYSDHTLSLEVSIAATALGASVFEKHFTLDRSQNGPDHLASLEPKELANLVSAIRNTELLIGTGIKRPSNSEVKNVSIARKSLVAARFIRKGEHYTAQNLTAKRPANGISPMFWPQIINRVAPQDFEPDEPVTW